MSRGNKEVFILALFNIFSAIFWLSLSRLLPSLSWRPSAEMISVFLAAFFIAVIWGLSVMLVERVSTMIVATAPAAFIGVVWFQSHVFVAAALLLYIFGVAGYVRSRSEIRNTLNGGIWRPLKKSVPLFVTFLIAAVAAAAFLKAPARTLMVEEILPEHFFVRTLGYLEPILKKVDADFEGGISYGEYLSAKAKSTDPTLTTEQIDLIVEASVTERREIIGGALSVNESLEHIIYIGSVNFIKRQIDLFSNFFPLAFALGLFLTLRLLAFPFYWLSMSLTIVTLRLLERFGIVGLREIPANVVLYTFN